MTRRRIRSTGPLRTVVVSVFLVALLTAPLRSCLAHDGHAHGIFAYAAHSSTEAVHQGHLGHAGQDGAPASDPEQGDGANTGCDCLGSCQLESPPPLPHGEGLTDAVQPGPLQVSPPDRDEEPTKGAPHAVPPARGPPALA